MAETSYLWDNPTTGDSPAGGYGHEELMEEMFRMLLNGTGNRGVLRGWLNELEVTDGGGLNAAVDTGGAVDYGFAYENDSATTVACPNNSTVHVVVRVSWAAQTGRLTQVAALTQTAGVTYDIPLAEVTTAGGAITLITDEREYCEFSTDLLDDIVDADHIPADAVTIAKLENQTRWVFRAAGTLEPDDTNPATWGHNRTALPYTDAWWFSATALNGVWITFRVPADYVSGTATLYIWNMIWSTASGGDVLWGWDSWDAQASAVLANQAGTLAVDHTDRAWGTMYRDALTTLTVAAGDIFHVEIYRDGAAGGDTEGSNSVLFGIEIAYTADS